MGPNLTLVAQSISPVDRAKCSVNESEPLELGPNYDYAQLLSHLAAHTRCGKNRYTFGCER